jgi:hypothetical protein
MSQTQFVTAEEDSEVVVKIEPTRRDKSIDENSIIEKIKNDTL